MTDPQLDNLDRLAAEKIMGWDFIPEYRDSNGNLCDVARYGPSGRMAQHWQPTRNIAQAFELLEKLDIFAYMIGKGPFGYYCRLETEEQFGDLYLKLDIEYAETAPLAITLACLKARGVNID